MEIMVRYTASQDPYPETWRLADVYCPYCRAGSVMVGGGEDYYLGETYLCLVCKRAWCLQAQGSAGADDVMRQRWAAIVRR